MEHASIMLDVQIWRKRNRRAFVEKELPIKRLISHLLGLFSFGHR